VRSQITHLACEEGWSYIAQWIGLPLSHILDLVGTLPQTRYVIYRSIQSDCGKASTWPTRCTLKLSSSTA